MRYENMLQYIINKNFFQVLDIWLNDNTSFITNYKTQLSPLSFVSNVTGESIVKWFKSLNRNPVNLKNALLCIGPEELG